MAKRPTRTDLLAVICVMQTTFGRIQVATSDRNPNRQAHIDALCQFGQELAIQARDADPPDTGRYSLWNVKQLDLKGVS